MFTRRNSKFEELLERLITRQLLVLETLEYDTPEFRKTLAHINQLQGMSTKKDSISKDTLAIVGANLLGILMIIKHEHVNVISSKALGFVMRPR